MGEGPATLFIVGYSDGDLTACPACLNNAGSAWDGTFERIAVCEWDAVSGNSISGKSFIGGIFTSVGFSAGQWNLLISCYIYGNDVIWQGVKTTGSNPTGIYTRVSGCDTTPTLTIGT